MCDKCGARAMRRAERIVARRARDRSRRALEHNTKINAAHIAAVQASNAHTVTCQVCGKTYSTNEWEFDVCLTCM